MLRFKDEPKIDGLLFKYLHFYGSYDYVGDSSKWYKHEIRVIRNDRSIYSYKDAQGFRKGNNEKLSVYPVDACIYHYGWVKEPKAMQRKQENFNKFWHDDKWIEAHILKADEFDYSLNVNQLSPFLDDHPKVMKKRIELKNWKFDHDLSINRKTLKDKLKDFLRNSFGVDINYKNYTIAKLKNTTRSK